MTHDKSRSIGLDYTNMISIYMCVFPPLQPKAVIPVKKKVGRKLLVSV